MKFPLDVLDAVRKRVGDEFIIGFRYTADEAQKGGITAKDGLEISKRLSETGQLDFLNVIRGRIHTDADLTNVIPVQGMPSAPHLDFAGEVKKLTGMPTFHASRIPDVATARHAIENNLLDMVGMTRAHMADPHIVKKIIEGREDDIRPCVGATYCLDRIYQAGDALCIHNPATGRELTMPHEITLAKKFKKVIIVVCRGLLD
jgi:2,4-dienoyl-CoA reductase-like NADH-dependent reductase (Old Yellow Enzyme family)